MSPHTGEAKENHTGVGFHRSIMCSDASDVDPASSQAEHFPGHPNTANLGAGAAKVSLQQTICSRQQTDPSPPHKEKGCIL